VLSEVSVDRILLVRWDWVDVGETAAGSKSSDSSLRIRVDIGTCWKESCANGCDVWLSIKD
jgi:hypothetical protein